MIIQKLSDGTYRRKPVGDGEFYNYPRVTAILQDPSGKRVKQRLNFPTTPYSSEKAAKEATKRNILHWIKTRGDSSYNTKLKLVSFIKDANKADVQLSVLEKIVNRMRRQGTERDLSTTTKEKAARMGVLAKGLRSAISSGNKNQALKLYAENVRLLRSLQKDPSVGEEFKQRLSKALMNQIVIENEIRRMGDAMLCDAAGGRSPGRQFLTVLKKIENIVGKNNMRGNPKFLEAWNDLNRKFSIMINLPEDDSGYVKKSLQGAPKLISNLFLFASDFKHLDKSAVKTIQTLAFNLASSAKKFQSKIKDMSPQEKKRKYELVRKKIHPDYRGKNGILVNQGGKTTIVNEGNIDDNVLNKLYKLYGGK